VLASVSVPAGDERLIFALPPSEIATHGGAPDFSIVSPHPVGMALTNDDRRVRCYDVAFSTSSGYVTTPGLAIAA
jgi:hypothetical protein